MDVFNRIQKKLGLWMRGQLILCFSIFALTYIGLSILGVNRSYLDGQIKQRIGQVDAWEFASVETLRKVVAALAIAVNRKGDKCKR